MGNAIQIGLIGDRDDSVPAHQAIPLALRDAARDLGLDAGFAWVPTEELLADDRISGFQGLWCVPASPYRSEAGALRAIRWARERGTPFLGTCGGFQHAILEYARNVLGWADAGHGETAPGAARAVIAPLSCALVEARAAVRFLPGTLMAAAYGVEETVEGYRCRYGMNPAFQAALLAGPLRTSAVDAGGDIRGVELTGHPFFLATLFQPERAALTGGPVPLARAFLDACRAHP